MVRQDLSGKFGCLVLSSQETHMPSPVEPYSAQMTHKKVSISLTLAGIQVLRAYCSTVLLYILCLKQILLLCHQGFPVEIFPKQCATSTLCSTCYLDGLKTKICLASKNRTLEQIRLILSKVQFFCQIFLLPII